MTNAKYLDYFGRPMNGIRKACQTTQLLAGNEGYKFVEIRYNCRTNKFRSYVRDIIELKSKFYGEIEPELYPPLPEVFFYTLHPMSMQQLAITVRIVMEKCGWI